MTISPELLKLAAEIDTAEHMHLAAAKPKGPGWEASPGGKHGAMRRKKSGGGFEYWYPSAGHAAKAAEEHEAESKDHAEKAGKSYSKAIQSGGAAQHHKEQANYHAEKRDEAGYGNAERRQKSDIHDEHHKSSKGDHEKHKAEEKKHKTDHREHTDKSYEHQGHASEAAKFVKDNAKKPGMWDKVKGLFGGGKKKDDKKDDKKKDDKKKDDF